MIGRSAIVAPSGEIGAPAPGEEDQVIFANCDLSLGEAFLKDVFARSFA